MRRFSRKRRSGKTSSEERPLDAQHWITQLKESGTIDDLEWTALAHADVPPAYAVVARAQDEAGNVQVVCFSPTEAGDALLAALATGSRLVSEEETFAGRVLAIAPIWSTRARRRLGLIRTELPFILEPKSAPALTPGQSGIQAESDLEPTAVPIAALAAQLVDTQNRALFLRTVRGLQGLAAKHGGSIRAFGRQVELVVSARRMAELRVEERQLALTTWGQQKGTRRLEAASLVDTLDELEGQVRRRVNDRKVKEGEEGLRARAIPLLIEAAGLREACAWPLGGLDDEAVDVAGLLSDGQPTTGAIRSELTLPGLGRFLDGLQNFRLAQTTLFAEADAPVLLGPPGFVLAASNYSSGALHALKGLAPRCELFRAQEDREKGLFLTSISLEEAGRALRDTLETKTRNRRGSRRRTGPSDSSLEAEAAPPKDGPTENSPEREGEIADSEERGGQGRRRSRRRGRGRGRPAKEESEAPLSPEASPSETRPAFDEVSLFELGEPEAEPESGRDRRRSRSRRRGGRDSEKGKSSNSEEKPQAQPNQSTAERTKSGDSDEDAEDIVEESFDDLAELPSTLEQGESRRTPAYEDDEETEAEPQTPGNPLAAPASTPVIESAPVDLTPKPRRRAVIVAAANRDAVSAAILLARDVRLLEGIWIYPQSELMHFFREVTTDLKDDVPIHLVGFSPSPAGEVLQAVSLYNDRISWYDHHEWPPEDVFALQSAIGEESLHYTPGAGSCLPAVLETGTRRSRFSDKLVDLVTGRFTQHDYERWGRLWWWRLGEIANKSGDVRKDIEGLLAGRPSDLAREAGRQDAPPIPSEVEWVSGRDFRLIHFAGYIMVLIEAAPEMDIHLTSRVARERYGAQISMTSRAGENVFHVTGDDSTSRRSLDYAALAQHLAEKLEWVTALDAQDHVARFSVQGLSEHPERLQEVVGEIAMGRSILER